MSLVNCLTFLFYSSNLQRSHDDLHLHVYDDDTAGKDSIGSAKIDLKKHDFTKSRYDGWVKLPALLGLRSKGELHVIIEHHVKDLLSFSQIWLKYVFSIVALKPNYQKNLSSSPSSIVILIQRQTTHSW